ncbi:hypothetical protein KP509_14G031300 [Ceratopteris richardii]|uniref:Protein kinase domain-containing protein n=1 Tax=Ceratopteris richardii TaxID=49495 RepID=A0A8T2TBS1_CERRI|nr:hypothetical protein KP509_14G031300 [Ceratopteris richardii]
MTCSVVVIQQGRVVFEREGYLNTSGKGNSRVLDAIQRTLKSHSRKHSNTSLDGRTKCLSSPSVETVMSHNDPGIIQWPLPVRFLDSPVNILQLRNRLSCKTRTMNPLDSPLSTSSPTPFSMEQNQGRAVSVCKDGQNDVSSCRQSLEDCFSQSEGSDNINDEAYATSGGKSPESSNELILSSSNQNRDFKSCTVKVGSDLPVTTTGSLQDKKPKDSISSFVGWPLLRKHFRANLNNSKLKTRRLSVVEWTLQLPERPRNVSHQAEPQKIDSFTSFFYRSNERICHDHPVIRDGSNGSEADYLSQYLEVDSIPQYYEDRLELRISKLSGMKPCKRFQLKDLQEATEGFASESIVGRGGCSQVYKGLIWEDTRVAVKCLNGSANEDEFFTEIEMLCNLKHDNIVQLIGYYIDRQQRMLVYNFASEGNLEQKLHGVLLGGKSMALLTWRARHNIAVGVANALEYLHDCHTPVIHMDVKSSNILLCSDLKPQLTDFGLAKLLPATSMQITCSDVVGTFGYLAPEYFMFGKVSQKTDVYSFGVVLLELITGRHPIDNTRAKGEENLVLWVLQDHFWKMNQTLYV